MSSRRRRVAVSELYASLVMLGATVTLGSVTTGLAVNEFGLTASTSQGASSQVLSAAGVQLSFLFATVAHAPGCPLYGATPGGSRLSVTVFDFGSTPFHPSLIVVNGTPFFSQQYRTVDPGAMAAYTVAMAPGTCAHPWGQEVVISDASGSGFQFET